MRVDEAKELVLDLMRLDLAVSGLIIGVDPTSPDPKDRGKFVLDGKIARAIHHFSGWNVPISPSWFRGGYDPPEIHTLPFQVTLVTHASSYAWIRRQRTYARARHS